VGGVNTRRIKTALTPLLGTAHLSKSAVSRIVGRLKALFATWQGLDLSAEPVCDRVLGRISSERAPGLGGHPKPAIN
jgi:hypothetical protein